MLIEGNKLHSGRQAAQDGPSHFAKNAGRKTIKNVGAVITVAILRVPESWPTTRKLVLPLTEVVTRPLCFLMRSSISWRCRDSSAPVITKVLPVKHSAWPLGTSCHAPHHHGGPFQLHCHCCIGHNEHANRNENCSPSSDLWIHGQPEASRDRGVRTFEPGFWGAGSPPRWLKAPPPSAASCVYLTSS